MVVVKETRNGETLSMVKTGVQSFSLCGDNKAVMFLDDSNIYRIEVISESDMMRALIGNVIITIETSKELSVITSIESL